LRGRLPAKPHISDTYISKICRGMFYTLKKLEACPADRNRDDVKQQRKDYARWFLEIAILSPRIIYMYIDESGFNVWTQRAYGRAPVGSRAVRTVSGQRGENLTLILAVSPQRGVEHFKFRTGGTNSEAMKEFFSELTGMVGLENRCIFILDNAPCHRALTTLSDNHVIKFLPPYSRMLTPVEHAFSAWKWSVKNRIAEPAEQASFTRPEAAQNQRMNRAQWRRHRLQVLGQESLPVITAEKCVAWQNHCTTYFPRCLALEDIFC
jgi:transposase